MLEGLASLFMNLESGVLVEGVCITSFGTGVRLSRTLFRGAGAGDDPKWEPATGTPAFLTLDSKSFRVLANAKASCAT